MKETTDNLWQGWLRMEDEAFCACFVIRLRLYFSGKPVLRRTENVLRRNLAPLPHNQPQTSSPPSVPGLMLARSSILPVEPPDRNEGV